MNELETFFQTFPLRTFDQGQVIAAAGTPLTHLYYLKSGEVKLRTTSSEGQQLMLHLFHPGACFPLLSLVHENTHEYDCIALTDVTVHTAPAPLVVDFIKHHPEISFELNQKLLLGLNGLLHRLQQVAFVPAYNQVAGVLLYFAKHFGQNVTTHKKNIIHVRLTHQDIAEWLGLSRENVSLQMKQLKRNGLIQKQDSLIEIIDLEKLEALRQT